MKQATDYQKMEVARAAAHIAIARANTAKHPACTYTRATSRRQLCMGYKTIERVCKELGI